MEKEIFILGAVRTPIGSFCKSLSTIPAPKLGSIAIKEALKRSGTKKEDIDEVLMGCVLTGGLGQAPARQASIFSGLPNTIPCTTVNKVCGSGLKTVMLGAQSILAGDSKTVVAGGMENMSRAPYLIEQARTGYRLGHGKVVDSMVKDGLWDVYNNFHMGTAAEMCVKKYKFSRAKQDEFAAESYHKAQKAIKEGYFKDEIVAVEVKQGKEIVLVHTDEEPMRVKFDKIATLPPVFDKAGSVTAANASTLNDGGAAVVISEKNNGKALAKICGFTQSAQAPEWFTTAPVTAVQKLLQKLNWGIDSVDLWEINEAFAVVTMAAIYELKLDPKKVNVHGGAVALGHPIGASGARILVTLLYALKRLKKKRGLATLCIGGGEAVALAVELL
ncbi:MAG: thiolase family protein [Deltaproteobacteria bacterium]|nr:thiolase family protein [Deltaproteobacteria bacterium]